MNATSGELGGSGLVAIARRDRIGGVTLDVDGNDETILALLDAILTTENRRGGGGRSSPSMSSSSSS